MSVGVAAAASVAFDTCVGCFHVSLLKKGRIVVMDNLQVHKSSSLESLEKSVPT
jgi:hypothetical protein